MDTDDKIPFTAHLEELRKRLIISFIAVGIGFALCYGFKEWLFQILTQPLISVMQDGETLIYTGLPEAFFTFLKVSFLGGLMIASPVIIYQFWMFVAPGLYDREKRLLLPIVFFIDPFFCGRRPVWLFHCLSLWVSVFPGLCHGNDPSDAVHEGVFEFFGQAAAGFWAGFRAAPGHHLSGPAGNGYPCLS